MVNSQKKKTANTKPIKETKPADPTENPGKGVGRKKGLIHSGRKRKNAKPRTNKQIPSAPQGSREEVTKTRKKKSRQGGPLVAAVQVTNKVVLKGEKVAKKEEKEPESG